jgi:hypothetical protein
MTLEQMELISLCLALLWLGGAVLYARANHPKEAYQVRRVPRAAAAFILGSTLIDLVLYALLGQLDVVFFHIVLVRALLIGMVFFLSVLLFDVAAVLLGAARTPGWLVAGIAGAVAISSAWLFLVSAALSGAGPDWQSLLFLSACLVAAAAGLVWWSELPHPDGEAHGAASGIFD